MIILGVTGSIGSGKSHFCKILSSQRGVRILSSDAEVHRLYAENKQLLEQVKKHFPKAVVNNRIDRKILGGIVFNDAEKRVQLEQMVYPILSRSRQQYIKQSLKDGVKLLVLEIPLLFENNLHSICDYTVTLYCAPSLEKKRVMRRAGMTEEKYRNIIAVQIPSHEKIELSDYYFNTGRSKEFIARAAKHLYLELIS